MPSGSTGAGAAAAGWGVLIAGGVERQLAVVARMPMMLTAAISCFVMCGLLS